MLSHASVIKSTPPQDLATELHAFLRGAWKGEKTNPVELAKTALRLLKSLPAARAALFEYFSRVFFDGASNYVQAIEKKAPISESDELVAAEIYAVLVSFINDNPTAWAPLVSSWSLELLGEISTKFAGRENISKNLNDTLQTWMHCPATKTLVDINTQCFSSLIHLDTETCINALLDTYFKHSPNFDWVVAHVGSSFPNTIITRVLSCGLKDFSMIKSYEQGSNSPKLRSVVGILGHLAGSHSNDIRSAIIEIFQLQWNYEAKDADSYKLQRKATVPFILQLCFLSPTLLSTICSNLKDILCVEVIQNMYTFVEDWCKYFGSNEILEELLLDLIISCDQGSSHIIGLLFDCVEMNENDVISDKALEILQNILYKIDKSVRTGECINLMKSFKSDVDSLLSNLLSTKAARSKTAAQILVTLGHDNPSLLVRCLGHMIENVTSDDQLALFMRMVTHELLDKTIWPYTEKGGYFSIALAEILSKESQEARTWCNILTLLRWEKSAKSSLLRCEITSRALLANLPNVVRIFAKNGAEVHVLAEILERLDIPKQDDVPVEVLIDFTQATVNYFFVCCEMEGIGEQIKHFQRIYRLFKAICTNFKASRVLALRELLERALFRTENVLFGAKNNGFYDDTSDKLLLKQNKKINKNIPLTKHSSVFNGGIIGNGKRKLLPHDQYLPEVIAQNTNRLIEALKSCCALPETTKAKYTDVSLESATLVSLLLVQFVSPDVMYNGLPWPEEEFSKVTIERDLFIRRLFTNTPVLWDLLNFIAVCRPALCYCSVLLRALTATLIHQWRSTGEQTKSNHTKHYKSLMETTVKVIDVMALGQLLPPPLPNIRDVLPFLQCYEIVAILKDCVWSYMRDHIPSPALFVCDANGIHWRDPAQSRPADVYTNTLRIIMQRNIVQLGHMYSQMFINIPKND